MSNWSVYIIQCDDGSLYTGISTDVERRFHQHLMQKGAKYFRSRQPRQLVFVEAGHDRVSASRKEALIKQMKRSEKLELIATYSR
ncbi:GIY-YIG nuclease family protein [Methylomonas sp. MK1]|uniref:GIY-YIG nuclease family protein n=1 Tax=Methylomonas sp. MK1 TaxID=1131552 RepID=UPI000477FDD5|nr:GIY-YIG nuclease family protein [Methylomonas sp. MK1]